MNKYSTEEIKEMLDKASNSDPFIQQTVKDGIEKYVADDVDETVARLFIMWQIAIELLEAAVKSSLSGMDKSAAFYAVELNKGKLQ